LTAATDARTLSEFDGHIKAVRETLHARALESAAALLGGEAALAAYLNVSLPRLALYLNGTALCPVEVSRKVVQLLLADDLWPITRARRY
jgi:hypothetical protein